MTRQEQEAIETTLDNFDFIKVHDVMKHLDWEWRGELPTVGILYKTARHLLEDSCSKNLSIHGTGGFTVYREEGRHIELVFSISTWEEDLYEI